MVNFVAKRQKTRTITRMVKAGRRSYSKGGVKSGGIVAGLIAGVGGSLLGRFLPIGQYSQPASDLAVGYFMKNETLSVIGGRSIGSMLAQGLNTGTSTGSTGGNLVG